VALVWYWWISVFFVHLVGLSFAEISSSFPVRNPPPPLSLLPCRPFNSVQLCRAMPTFPVSQATS